MVTNSSFTLYKITIITFLCVQVQCGIIHHTYRLCVSMIISIGRIKIMHEIIMQNNATKVISLSI